jgi:hypothetical protein
MEPLSKSELADLKRAKVLLENPGIAAKLSSMVGSPVEKGMKMLPARWQKSVHTATEAALMKALDVAVSSLGKKRPSTSSDRLHKIAAAASGAAGGALGLVALAWELPVSTTVMLRSIADIAAAEGEDPRHLDTKLACLMVFALGSTKDARDNAAESGYFAARSALVRLIGLIASRFGIVVSEKAAAQAIPILGAAGGALINTIFIGHYQDMARGHFIVRRLEKVHGAEPVEEAYRGL